MFASILEGDREQTREDIDALWQQVVAQPGLVTAYVLASVDDPRDGLVLSVWESEDAFNAYADSALRADVEATSALTRKNYYVQRAALSIERE